MSQNSKRNKDTNKYEYISDSMKIAIGEKNKVLKTFFYSSCNTDYAPLKFTALWQIWLTNRINTRRLIDCKFFDPYMAMALQPVE